MSTHILYHANCADGFAAACIAVHSMSPLELHLQPVRYEDPESEQLPKLLRYAGGEDVMYLDYTPPLRVIESLLGISKEDCVFPIPVPDVATLFIIDHHGTAEKIHRNLKFSQDTPVVSVFDRTKSGALLTWDKFLPGPAPRAIQLLDFYDLGGPWTDPTHPAAELAKNLQAGLMNSMPRTPEAWLPVLLDSSDGLALTACIERGRRLREISAEIITAACRKHLWLDIAGHRVPAITGINSSQTNDAAHQLLDMYPHTAEFAVVFSVLSKTGQIKYSLRSRKGGFDVAALAASQDSLGGGHHCAAGYASTSPLPLSN